MCDVERWTDSHLILKGIYDLKIFSKITELISRSLDRDPEQWRHFLSDTP